jgi:multidrug resistance efflux pump
MYLINGLFFLMLFILAFTGRDHLAILIFLGARAFVFIWAKMYQNMISTIDAEIAQK